MDNNIAIKSLFGISSSQISDSNTSRVQRSSYSFSGFAYGMIDRLSRYYSSVLEQRVSRRQTFHLLHAQVAFLSMLLLAGVGVISAAVGVAWFAWAVRLCGSAMRSEIGLSK